MSWPLVKFGNVAPAKASKHAFSTSDEVWTLNLDQVEADTGKVLGKIMAPVSEAGTSTHGFDEQHVLYSKLRPYLNKVVLPDERGLATTELVPMLPDPLRLDRKYLAYYLRSKSFVDWVSSQVAGAKMPRVSMQLFWQHEIPLPPLPEQKRIAAILDKADAIRRKRQQAIQLADDFLRAVFLDMFGDPVINPKGWDVKPLSAGIRSISSGWSASGESRPCSDGEKGVLKISAVTSGVFKPEENKVVPPDRIPDGKKLLFPKKGDLLFSRANTRELVAASCIVSADVEDAFLPDKLWLVEADQELILPEFLHFLLWQPRFKERLTSQATGTSGSMLNISKRKFEETYTIFPDIKVQKKFKDIYWAFQTTNGISTTLKAGVDKLFCSLNQKAFSGQL